jgi:L-2-hydroxycarboxylate dehydrogenase (NAD+)
MGSNVDERRTGGQWWDSTEPTVLVGIADLERVGVAAYESVGASADDAAFLFRTNLDKAIQGDHARGLVKVPGLIGQARAGTLDVAPDIEVVTERPACAVVDGGPTASGRLVSRFAMDLAIEKARTNGVAMVAARSSGEILTPYVRQATDAGMVGMAMVQSVPTVAPHGGRGPLLGNAPFAVGVPAGDRPPLILDMSFTESSASGVLLAARQGQQVPPGTLLDADGQPTIDAADFPDPALADQFGEFCVRGTLVPLGGGHKGAAMVLVVGLLSHLLSDTSPPWELYYHLEDRGRYGTLLWAVDPTAFAEIPLQGVRSRVDSFLDRVKSSPRIDGVDEIHYPGEQSQRLVSERREEGVVAVPASHAEGIVQIARDLGMVPPAIRRPEETQ